MLYGPVRFCMKDCPVRRLLCVFPRYAPSFGSFEFSYPLTDGIRAFMPPQGLLVIAASVPASWQVRFIDENIAEASEDDFAWAEIVFVSGMHVQRRQMESIRRRGRDHQQTLRRHEGADAVGQRI